jgi:hypothetical protein
VDCFEVVQSTLGRYVLKRPVPPDVFDGSQASFASGKSSLKIEMHIEHRWNDTDRGELQVSDRNLSQCYLVHQKSHIDWPGIETGFLAHRVARLTLFISKTTSWCD